MTIGERIHAARKSKGLSQEMIAAKLGVSRQAVTRWESGKPTPAPQIYYNYRRFWKSRLGNCVALRIQLRRMLSSFSR